MDNFIYFLLTISSVSTIAIWLGKFVITKSFDLGIEKYKSTLAKDIEEHKKQLEKISLEHQVKFTKLHDERAQKIRTLYGKVIELEKALIYSTTIAQGPDYINDTARDDASSDKLRELINQLDFDKIYFSTSTILKFESIIKESWEIIRQMRKVRMYAATLNANAKLQRRSPEIYYSETDLWVNADERTQNEFKILKEELANEFRQLLGI